MANLEKVTWYFFMLRFFFNFAGGSVVLVLGLRQTATDHVTV